MASVNKLGLDVNIDDRSPELERCRRVIFDLVLAYEGRGAYPEEFKRVVDEALAADDAPRAVATLLHSAVLISFAGLHTVAGRARELEGIEEYDLVDAVNVVEASLVEVIDEAGRRPTSES